jgi:hypothetical integral membrane protein (TIGR02206 family)
MFRAFFSYDPGTVFREYGASHIIALALFIAVCLAMWLFRRRLRALPNQTERRLRTGFVISALALESVFKGWLIFHGKFNLTEILSLELCYLSLILTMAAALAGSEVLFRITYFWWFGGILSLVFPVMGEHVYGPDRFRYYHFFIIHSSFIWMSLYLLWIKGYQIDRRSLKISAGVLMVILAIARILNGVFGLNFMFLMEPPFRAPFIDMIYAVSPTLYMILFMVLMAVFGLAVSSIPLAVLWRESKRRPVAAISPDTR